MALGPDGALYIADFYTQIFENMHFSKRHPGRDHRRGRIWRISHSDRPLLKHPRIKGEPVKALLGLLKSHESSTREFARRELQQRPAGKVIPALDEWLKNLKATDPDREHHRTEALWVRQGLNEVDAVLLQQQLKSANPSARAAATKVLRYWQEQIGSGDELIRQMVNDPEPRVRLHAVIAASFSTSPKALAIAMEASVLPVDPGIEHAGADPWVSLRQARARRRNRPELSTTGQAIAAWGESERGNHGPTPDAGGKLVKRSDECPGSRPVELPERDAGRPARWPSRH